MHQSWHHDILVEQLITMVRMERSSSRFTGETVLKVSFSKIVAESPPTTSLEPSPTSSVIAELIKLNCYRNCCKYLNRKETRKCSSPVICSVSVIFKWYILLNNYLKSDLCVVLWSESITENVAFDILLLKKVFWFQFCK